MLAVEVGRWVTIHEAESGRKQTFLYVKPDWQRDPNDRNAPLVIRENSPVGQALLGEVEGVVVEVDTSAGHKTLTIMKVESNYDRNTRRNAGRYRRN